MNTELHKRLEEAAEKDWETNFFRGVKNLSEEDMQMCARSTFILGGKWMFKEAIAQAKEWLIDNLGYYNYDAVRFGESLWECIAKDFRKAMTEKTNPLFEQCLAKVDPDTRKEVRENMEESI